MSVDEAVRQGDFAGALRLLDAELGAAPDPGRHFLAFQLRALVEDFDGAAASLAQLERLGPDSSGAVAELRKCLTAATMRANRRVDVKLAGERASLERPPPHSLRYVDAAALHARGDHAAAARLLAEAREVTPPLAGSLTFRDGSVMAFADITDSDELTGPHLECVGSERLLDIPFHSISAVEFLPPRGYQDLLWKPARITDRRGQVNLRVFSLYTGTGRHEEATVRTGEVTMWDHSNGYALGAGLRDLKLDGKALIGIHRVQRLDFDVHTPAG